MRIAQIRLDALGPRPLGVDHQNAAAIDGDTELGTRCILQRQLVTGARTGPQFVAQTLEPHKAFDPREQLNVIDRLGQKIVGAGFKTPYAVGGLVERRDHHDRDMGRYNVALEDLATGEPVHFGHHHIKQDDIDILAAADFDGLRARRRRHHVEILSEQARFEQFHIGGNVINDEHSCSHGARPFGPE